MTQIDALLKTSREALQLARSLQDAGRTAPATYYACHAFEMGGNAFVAAREVELKPSHSNLNRFRPQYHRAGLKRSLDPVLLRVRALREPSRYPLEDPERTGEWNCPFRLDHPGASRPAPAPRERRALPARLRPRQGADDRQPARPAKGVVRPRRPRDHGGPKLRGKRPPKVVGRMKGRQLIDHIERMRREHTDEQEEESWAVVEESLRN